MTQKRGVSQVKRWNDDLSNRSSQTKFAYGFCYKSDWGKSVHRLKVISTYFDERMEFLGVII